MSLLLAICLQLSFPLLCIVPAILLVLYHTLCHYKILTSQLSLLPCTMYICEACSCQVPQYRISTYPMSHLYLLNRTSIMSYYDVYIPLADEAMNFLVLRILELSNKEVDTPLDVVDLGQGSAEHKAPKYETVIVPTRNDYTKTAKLNGLPGHIPESSKSDHSSCCF